jgi:hypothetical protein
MEDADVPTAAEPQLRDVSAPAPPTETDGLVEEVAALRRELAALRADVDALRERLGS